MSRPRAATSVPTRMGVRPLLNSRSASSRSRCVLSPWMDDADYLEDTLIFVETKRDAEKPSRQSVSSR